MKKFLLIFCLLVAPCHAYDYDVNINALNLNVCQRKQKELIDEEYASNPKKQTSELKKILTFRQKSKLREINRLQRRADNHADKRLFKPDPNVRVFGMKEECCCKGRARKRCPNHSSDKL